MTTDDLEDRLRRLGQAPIVPEIEVSHRRAMAEAVSAPVRARFGWRAIALAVVAGFLVGSTSLAAAGSLPAPAQDVAHDVLDVVGIGVPRSTEGCPEGSDYRNHGKYVSAVEASGGDVEAAAHSDCGKPAHSGRGNDTDNEGSSSASPDADGDPCTGPPPWAGTHLDPEAKEAARAEREATCGSDDDADETDVESEDVEEEDPAPRSDATTTTVPDDTTTTVPAESTTTETAETTTTSASQP